MSLLDKAKAVKSPRAKKKLNWEEVELYAALINGEITPTQVTNALGKKKSSAAYTGALTVITEAIRQGILKPLEPTADFLGKMKGGDAPPTG
jgi:hypothetical protein